jgi:pimeloyl-ACP methyl ester carboxylesterase
MSTRALPHDLTGRGPAVVLVHAGVADRAMWSDQLEPIAREGFRVLAPDLPGFGDAPPVTGPPFMDVLATMDARGIERATLVGNSFGGFIALCAAVTAPERVDGLVLVSAPPPRLVPSPALEAVWTAEGEALERGDVEGAVASVIDAWTMPDAPETLRGYIAASQRRTLMRDETPEDWEDPVEGDPEILRRLRVPALVTAGEHEFPDFVEGARWYAKILPDARHTIIPGAGHLAPLETPDAFRRLLLDFLRR